jgi:hypothetical protein
LKHFVQEPAQGESACVAFARIGADSLRKLVGKIERCKHGDPQ